MLLLVYKLNQWSPKFVLKFILYLLDNFSFSKHYKIYLFANNLPICN